MKIFVAPIVLFTVLVRKHLLRGVTFGTISNRRSRSSFGLDRAALAGLALAKTNADGTGAVDGIERSANSDQRAKLT